MGYVAGGKREVEYLIREFFGEQYLLNLSVQPHTIPAKSPSEKPTPTQLWHFHLWDRHPVRQSVAFHGIDVVPRAVTRSEQNQGSAAFLIPVL